MGNCVSFAPQGVPKCSACGKQGEIEWHIMNPHQRRAWVWTGDTCTCKACLVKEKHEQLKYEKEREFYKKAKGELYPRPEPPKRLKRIYSNEAWHATQSFYESWKLPSSLSHLMQTAMAPLGQRKGTGVVGGATAAAAEQEQGSDAGQSGSGPAYRAASEELEALDEEIEMVEEHSLSSSDCTESVGDGSVHGGESQGKGGSLGGKSISAGQSRRVLDLG